MKHWRHLLAESICSPAQLPQRLAENLPGLEEVVERYPMRINPYYLSLIERPGDPFWMQAVPDPREMQDSVCLEDPLGEENLSPVPNLVHKYPDRALFLVHSQCAMYCRFCTRKRKVGTELLEITGETVREGLEYLRRTVEIRDVLLSGGDPLLLSDERLEEILTALRSIPHLEIIRIGSRVPCTLPMRVTVRLASMLKKYHPLYINTHFNHPGEITMQAAVACTRLANAGIPLGCQTVLLRGVNDDSRTIRTLMHRLLSIRVKPYYLFQADMTRGTNHFRTRVEQGLAIIKDLIGHTSGLAVPCLAVDAPGGGGKIPLLPDFEVRIGESLTFQNYRGQFCSYRNPS
jgi:lysine 2,3-aminomutase